MALNIEREVAAMQQMTVGQLQTKFETVFGATPQSRRREWSGGAVGANLASRFCSRAKSIPRSQSRR
jgi:hypothetical protein